MKPQFAVLHLQKPNKDDKGGIKLSAHIERTITPANADSRRTHLNRELVAFPDKVQNRTEAISHRIATAGIKRKIGDNQCRFIAVMLSGSPEQMKRLEAEGKLDDWCKDNLIWLRDTFGEQNLVSAVLHRDETTPHIHATIVPIVQGERRKAKQSEQDGKRKYRKKNPEMVRLCADDVMARDRLKHYQDTYARAMNKYGLQRGVDGSKAKHISTAQYYKNLVAQGNEVIEKARQDIRDNIRKYFPVCLQISRSMAQIGLPVELRQKLIRNEPIPLYTGHLLNPDTKEAVSVQDVALTIGVSEERKVDLCLNKLSIKGFFAQLVKKQNLLHSKKKGLRM